MINGEVVAKLTISKKLKMRKTQNSVEHQQRSFFAKLVNG